MSSHASGAVTLRTMPTSWNACSRISVVGLVPASTVAAFHTVFVWTVPFMGLSLVLALAMREKPLSDEMIEVAEGKVEVPEY